MVRPRGETVRIIDLGYTPFVWMVGFDHDEWHAQWQREPVQLAYRALVRRIAAQVIEGRYFYQREPNLRIHPPGGTAVSWHTDADFGHLPHEYNVWVPLTVTTDDSQRLWVWQDPGSSDRCAPVHVPFGSAFVFLGATVKHGNQVNTTDETRISFDFRLLAKEHYRDTGAKTVLYDVPLRYPEYWEEMTGD